MGIGLCYRYEEKKREAETFFKQALTLAPEHSDIHANLGCMYVNDGRPEGGVRWLKKAIELDPEHPEAKFNLGLLQLEMGQWREGFENYDKGSKRKDGLGRTYTHPDGRQLKLWAGEAGKRIVVYGEQGIGDEIMFASCVPDLQAMSELVVLDCHPRLATLFKRSFGVDCYGTRKDEWLNWVLPYKFNSRTPIGSLPRYLRAERRIPEEAVPDHRQECRRGRAARFKIGIAWRAATRKRAPRSAPCRSPSCIRSSV
jgi:tetratricopeptide (TPR) repeat protein